VVVWEPLVQFVERSVGRGDRIYVEGRLEYRQRSARSAGDPIAEIVADELILVDSRQERAQPTPFGKENFVT
jgi:single-stranded DNA-binding protein